VDIRFKHLIGTRFERDKTMDLDLLWILADLLHLKKIAHFMKHTLYIYDFNGTEFRRRVVRRKTVLRYTSR